MGCLDKCNYGKFAVVVLLGFFCISCDRYYIEPVSGKPRALVRFVAPDSAPYGLQFFEDTKCEIGRSGFLGAPGMKAEEIQFKKIPPELKAYGNSKGMILSPKISEVNYVERSLPVGNEVAVTIIRLLGNTIKTDGEYSQSCFVTLAFTPEDNSQYEVNFANDKEKCYVKIESLTSLKNSDGTINYIRKPFPFRLLNKACPVA